MWNLGTLADHVSPKLQRYQPIYRKCYVVSLDSEDSGAEFGAFALLKSVKKVGNVGKTFQSSAKKVKNLSPKGFDVSEDNTGDKNEDGFNTFNEPVRDNLSSNSSLASPARDTVLKACTITSGVLVALSLLIRQASHVASMEGWPILDASAEVSFGLEMQHVPLTIGMVALVSSCRYILLKAWPEFSKSSELANQQVLGSLQDLDYLVVAFLSGFSEELLFRGALLPLFGLNWESAMVVGAIFGGLHLGGGRRYPFAVWASFVGFLYGMATIVSSNIMVPIVSHSLSNLIGAILWRYKSTSEKIE